jgi:metallopeptidase MepB
VQNVLEFENGLKDKLIPFGLKEKEKLLKLKEEEKKSLNLPFDGEINAWDFR